MITSESHIINTLIDVILKNPKPQNEAQVIALASYESGYSLKAVRMVLKEYTGLYWAYRQGKGKMWRSRFYYLLSNSNLTA